MATETVNGIYKYTNRVRGTVPPGDKVKIEQLAASTGSSESSIVAEAVNYYLKNYENIKNQTRQPKHSY
jgi:hypothetical protein